MKEEERNIVRSSQVPEIYHLGIIDYLQRWDTNKKSERFLKTKILQKDASKLSAIEPIEY